MTHHKGHQEEQGHRHVPGSHPAGYKHHKSECPYCQSGGFKIKDEEIKALESYKKDIGEQMAYVDRRLEELRKG